MVSGFYGCLNTLAHGLCSSTSNLTDDDFTHASTDYEIVTLLVRSPARLELEFDTDIATGSENLILDVAGTEFAFDDADGKGVASRSWNSSGLSWSAGDTIAVKLLEPSTDSGANNEPTGLPTITGTAQVGQTLTANTSGIGDADGLGTFSYQWIRGAATDIAGATASTYQPVAADVGHTLKVRVSWTDGAANAESLDSAPTAVVTAAAIAATLVSNLIQTGNGSDARVGPYFGIDRVQGQRFTTGNAAGAGYTLSSVTVNLSDLAPDDVPEVSIYKSTSRGFVGTILTTLTNPATVSNGDLTFTAPANTTLEKQTKYYVVIKAEGDGTAFVVNSTTSNDEGTAATGWSINNDRTARLTSSTIWGTQSDALRIKVIGTVGSNTAPTAVGNTITVDQGDTYTFSVSDFPFEDADGDTLQSVSINNRPVKGTMQLDGAPVPIGEAIPVADIEDGKLTYAPAAGESGTAYANFSFRVSDGTDQSGTVVMTITVTPAPPPVVQFQSSAASLDESDTDGHQVVAAQITGTRQGTISVVYTVSSSGDNAATPCPAGTAVSSCSNAGYDFYHTLDGATVADFSQTSTIAAHTTRLLIPFFVLHDTADEPNETFTVTLSSPNGATLGTNSVLTVTIVDDDEAVPAAPTNLRTTTVRALEAVLAWDAVAGADSYQYRVQGEAGTWSAWTDQTETGSGISTFVRGLAPASAYGFQVRAVNSGGTGGAASASLSVTTGTLSWTVATDGTDYTEGDDITVTVSAVVTNYVNVTDCPSSVPLYLALDVSDPDGVLSNAATRTLTFGACQPSKMETFATVDDNTEEDAAAVTFTLALGSGGSTPHLSGTLGATPPSAQVTVADNDEPATLPVVQFDSFNVNKTVQEGYLEHHAVVVLSPSSTSDVTVQYTVEAGGNNLATPCPSNISETQCNNSSYDFRAGSGTLTFLAGITQENISVILFEDTADEPDETFTVTLSSPSGATLGSRSVSTITIQDDDEPAPNTNNPPTGVPTITGTPQVGRTLTANTSGIGDADGLGTFAYQWIRGAAANIAGATGSTYRPVAADIGHTLKVRVSWTDGGGTAESLTSAPTAAVTDSIRPKLLFSGGLAETEGSGEASVWAIVQPASSEDISFRVHTSDYALAEAGRDYVALDRIVTIPVGETYAAFPVRLIDDSIAEHHEQFTITVSQVRGAELHYARYTGGGVWGPDGHGPHGRISDVIEIRDDDGGDAAVITLMTLHEPRRAPEVVEGGVIEIMVNRRGGPDTGDVSVTVNVAESGGDRVASGDEGRRTVTLERGFENAQYRSTYYLRIPTRATGGGDGRLVVTVEDGTGYTVGEQSRVTVKLIDRAAPTPTVTLRAVRNSATEGEDLEFTLTRTGAVEEEVHVGVEVSETGHLVTGYPSVVRIEGGERSATFTVETLNDPDSGTGSVVTVSLTEDAERYRLGGPSSVTVTVTDARSSNQAARLPEVSISAAAQSAAEGATLTFTLTSTEAAEAELAVGLEVSESGAMLAAYPVRVVIPAGAASATFDILTLNDETDETDSVVTVSIAEDGETYETGDPSSVSVTDDDEAAATPLTAEFQDAPAAHNGVDAFTLRIAFSEAVAVSYRTLRDQALEVTGGSVTRAKRVDGRSDLWEITIAPDGDGGVNVVLPVTDDCDAEGAICTGDGGMLSNRLELTIPGPVAEEQNQQTPPENSPATGAPAITGTAQVGETLTADTAGIADEDGLDNAAFSYQWLADGADIQGATASGYTLQDADGGKAVRVKVSFTDDAGNDETLTSAATAAVEAAVTEEEPTAPPPAPTNLTAVVNADGSVTLTWDAPDDDSVTGYLILRRRPYEGERALLVYVENTGSTATTFTDTGVTAGTQHVYRVKAINDAGPGAQSNYVNADP